MENVKELILELLENNPNRFAGINFLINFLKTTYITRNGIKVALYDLYTDNVISCNLKTCAKKAWVKIAENGDVKAAIDKCFDWGETPEKANFWNKVDDTFKQEYKAAVLTYLNPNAIVPRVVQSSVNPNYTFSRPKPKTKGKTFLDSITRVQQTLTKNAKRLNKKIIEVTIPKELLERKMATNHVEIIS